MNRLLAGVAILASIALVAFWGVRGIAWALSLDEPSCPTEDSCAIDYRDGLWWIDGERVTR